MTSRELVRGAALAEQIASALSGRAHILSRGDSAQAFIAVGGRAPLVFADNLPSASLAMPDGRSWSLATRADWDTFVLEVREAIASYAALEPLPIALGDVAIAIVASLERVAGAPWRVSMGRPITSAVDFERDFYRVRLRHEDATIRVEVFMAGGQTPTPTTVGSTNELASIAIVVERQLEAVAAEIAAMLAARDAEARAARARTNESFDDVLAALRRGERVETRGPRWEATYFWEEGELRCESYEEGFRSERSIEQEELRAAVDRHPDPFARSIRGTADS